MKDNLLYNLAYMAAIGLICAVLLTGASVLLGPKQQAKTEAHRARQVLKVLDVPVPADADAREVIELFEQTVRPAAVGDMQVYEYRRDGRVVALAVPFSGRGVWAPIKGYLAFEPDRLTLRGLIFTDQEETPGLGGEIESDTFRDRFVGKRVARDGEVGLDFVQPGRAEDANDIVGISGATATTEKVEEMVNATIRRFVTAAGREVSR